jgi:ketosteroid isomerase-like protein
MVKLPAYVAAIALVVSSPTTRQDAVQELLAADRAFSAASATAADLASGLSPMLADDVIVQVPGNRFVEGKAAVIDYLRGTPDAKARAEWTPMRGGISADGQHGFTFGFMTIRKPDGTRAQAKYMGYWVKGASGWRAVVYKARPAPDGEPTQTAMPPAAPARLVPPSTDTATIERFRKSLDDAERAFSAEAQKIGVGPAFKQFGSADAVNMGGPNQRDYAIGADAIGERIGANTPAGPAAISWAPDKVIVASSGDLGVTIGWIRPNKPSPDRPAQVPFFTIWRRPNTDAPWRYVAE